MAVGVGGAGRAMLERIRPFEEAEGMIWLPRDMSPHAELSILWSLIAMRGHTIDPLCSVLGAFEAHYGIADIFASALPVPKNIYGFMLLCGGCGNTISLGVRRDGVRIWTGLHGIPCMRPLPLRACLREDGGG